MKIKKSDLKLVIRGKLTIEEAKIRASKTLSESLLREDVPTTSATNPEMLENDSLDSQIDRLLMQGESNKPQEEMGNPAQAATENSSTALEGYQGLNLKMLLEVGEENQATAPAPPAPQQQAPENPPPQEPAQQKNSQALDAVTFADNVARIVEKHESLLDIRGTIVRRSLNWITKNYDAKQAKEVRQILEANFGITPDNASDPYEDDQAPPAKGAGVSL